MKKILLAFPVLTLVLTATITTNAQEWTQWRGPARDGSVSGKNVPAKWPETFARAWRVEVGEGYSSPVVAAGRVFVHSRRDPEEIISAINLADGKVMWEQKYQATFKKNQYAVEMAKGPNSTPLVVGNRLFTLGVTAVLNAWDTATGRLLWSRDFSKSIDTSKMFCGTAASPIAVDGRIVIQVGSDIHGGQILALNPATGAAEWEWRGLRSEEHTSELQSLAYLVCRLLLEKKKQEIERRFVRDVHDRDTTRRRRRPARPPGPARSSSAPSSPLAVAAARSGPSSRSRTRCEK